MGYPVSFVKGNDTSGPHQCGHLGNNLLRLGNVYQNQAGRGKIEGFSWQPGLGGVPLANLDVVYLSLCKKFSSELDGVVTEFNSNDRALGTDPARQ